MKKNRFPNNEKGVALISVYLASIFMATIAGAAFTKSFFEMRQVEREIARLRSFAAAEAGVQNGLVQIAANGYTGFINTASMNVASFQAVDGTQVGSFSVSFDYPNQADWVTVQSTATVDGDTRVLEGRVFLDSNLSKYLVYADTADFGSGNNAQYGEPDTTDANHDGQPDYPELVPPNENNRAAVYFTGNWIHSGSNVKLYGDSNAEGKILGNSSAKIHGDTYSGSFSQTMTGIVTDSGVTGGVKVGDGFADDTDRNGDGSVTAADYPDYHKLSAAGGGDSHKKETLTPINHNFYTANNSTPQFGGAVAQSRYLQFVPINNGAATQIVEYSNASFTSVVSTQNLQSNAIVYVKGNTYVKGEIGGRVSVVSSNSIYLDGNLTYANGQKTADATHSAALLAKDKVYFRANDLTVSGILYGENSGGGSTVFNGSYNTQGQLDPGSKEKLRLYGNRVMKGSTNLSVYPDRVYGYDKNLKYFRPPGIPVVPSLRTVREK